MYVEQQVVRVSTDTFEQTLTSILLSHCLEISPTEWAHILGVRESELKAWCKGTKKPERRMLLKILRQVNACESRNNVFAQAFREQVAAYF